VGSIGGPEILLILVIALLLFGPTKLPELGKSLGRALREFKKASQELQDTIEREVDDLKHDVSPPPAGPQSRGVLPAPQRSTEQDDPYKTGSAQGQPETVPPPELPFGGPGSGPEPPNASPREPS